MTDAEIRSEMKSIDEQIEKLRARREELQREDDARFMETAKKNIGRCFRRKNEYVKVVGIPYEEFHLLLYICPMFVAASHRRGTSRCLSC